MKARSSKTVKPHGAAAPAPYTDAELQRLKQRLREGAHVNRTHALRLLATIERSRERATTAAKGLPQAQYRRATVGFDTTRAVELTPIQLRVLSELCAGRRTREIATLLERSAPTIHAHVRLLRAAFGAHTRAALIAQAIRHNVVSLEALQPSRRRRTS